MSMIETEETNQFTFEPFAAHTFYTDVNRSFVRQALASFAARPTNATLTIVDMACGTGAITRLIAEEMTCLGRPTHIIGVDPSAEALRRAQKGMEATAAGVKADFIQGETADLPGLIHKADAVFFCNAIHLVPDKLAAFREAFLLAIAPSLTAPMSQERSGSTANGRGALWVGCARNTPRYAYHAMRKRWQCSGLPPKNISTCSSKVVSAR
jgi:ubiquinone/menaquinone biosynthesis C-methylase UbiE